MEIIELNKSGIMFSALKLLSRGKQHVEARSLQLALRQKRNDLTIIKNAF